MQYTPHKLRVGISNAESSLRWLSQKGPQNMTQFEVKAVELNILRINKFQKLLDASKSFTPKYL